LLWESIELFVTLTILLLLIWCSGIIVMLGSISIFLFLFSMQELRSDLCDNLESEFKLLFNYELKSDEVFILFLYLLDRLFVIFVIAPNLSINLFWSLSSNLLKLYFFFFSLLGPILFKSENLIELFISYEILRSDL
jgi:hypothetical protein